MNLNLNEGLLLEENSEEEAYENNEEGQIKNPSDTLRNYIRID